MQQVAATDGLPSKGVHEDDKVELHIIRLKEEFKDDRSRDDVIGCILAEKEFLASDGLLEVEALSEGVKYGADIGVVVTFDCGELDQF